MIYLYAYLGIGIAVLAVIYLSHRRTRSPAEDILRELREASDPRPDLSRLRRFVEEVLVPLLAAIAVVIVWPVVPFLKIKEMLEKRNAGTPEAIVERVKEFDVMPQHLLRQWSLAEIEAIETVEDPLGAAPRSPFGHLNPAWESFSARLEEGDTIWSFAAPWTADWGRKESREGYAIKRKGNIVAFLVTRRLMTQGDGAQKES